MLRNIRKNCLADGLSDDFLNRLAFLNDKIDLENEAGLKQDLRENGSRQAWLNKESRKKSLFYLDLHSAEAGTTKHSVLV